MCLAIPGKVLSINGNKAYVDFDGVKRDVILGLCNGVKVGSYVIVHAGYAIQIVEEEEAIESIKIWRDIMEQDEFKDFNKEDII
ncbi:MAG: HypC/HybG/HupF family hydrogenase formation chaperone [Promethearchaeota archaeon]